MNRKFLSILCSACLPAFVADGLVWCAEYRCPKELVYYDKTPDTKPSGSQPESIQVNYARFYPIGWSRDGLFSFITCMYSDGKGATDCSLCIQNLATDRVEVPLQTDNQPEDNLDGDEAGGRPAVQQFWNSRKKQIGEILARHGIVQEQNSLRPFPCRESGDVVRMEIDEKCDTEKEEIYGRSPAVITIHAVSERQGRKVLLEARNELCGAFAIRGYLSSSITPRIAVFVTAWLPGWEGPPDDIFVRIVGCHPGKGFSKSQ